MQYGRIAFQPANVVEHAHVRTHKQTIAKYEARNPVANKYGGGQRIAADASIVELHNRPIVAAFAISDDARDCSGRVVPAS